jgi:cyclopropane fatty-acyl-phospholipid synthase-like methyltransferase
MNVKLNAWEVTNDRHAMLALAGETTRDEFVEDRQKRAAELLDWCQIAPGKRGFEIGSGEGTVARIVSQSCLGLDCNDISESFLKLAKEQCADCENVNFFNINTDYLDHLSDEFYEFGYSLNVFIHFNPYDIYNYLVSVRRILKPGGLFFFDACTLGRQTMSLFREHAQAYRAGPENIRGLMNFNDANLLRTLIKESGLRLSDRSHLSEAGWMKILVTRD